MTPVTVAQSRAIAAGRDEAYRITIPIDLTVLFRRWYGPIPPIKAVRDQEGEWSTAGQTRTVLLTGGGSMREELIATAGPGSFSYRLTDITGAMSPLVDRIDGEWRFDATGPAATTVTWRWTLHPRAAVVRPVVVLLGKLWNGYARGALAELETHIVRGA